LKQFVLDHFQSVYFASCRLDTEAGDLLIELPSGQKVALTIINRAVQFNEIKERYDQNTRRRIHTLFVIDRRMIPPDHSEVEAPGWLLTLHNLTHRRVYAYWCDGREVTIRPIHFGWNWGSTIRSVQYGEVVNTAQLVGHWAEATIGAVTGTYATANFNEGSFWKKQDFGDTYNYYSWRSWRYSERNNSNQSATEDEDNPDWEWWEEFRHEENFAESEPHAEYENPRRQRQQHQQPPPYTSRGQSDRAHYSLLGVSTNASLDEVKQAYRRKALEFHPDLHPEYREKYTAKMADINAAFEAIRRKLNR
jgi:hypothetical protein